MCTSPNRIFYWSNPRAPDDLFTKFTYGERVHHIELDSSGHVRCSYDDNVLPSSFRVVKDFYTVGCGKCMECRLLIAKQRSERMIMETLTQGLDNCWFVTLTYDNDHLSHLQRALVEIDMSGTYVDRYSLSRRDVQLFIKKVRKALFGSKQGNLRYVAVGEYGDKNERPHYHIIFWNLPLNDLKLDDELTKSGEPQYLSNFLSEKWSQGNEKCSMGRVTVSNAEQGSIAYTARYVQKKQFDDPEYYVSRGLIPPFILQSKGIGRDFLIAHADHFLKQDTIFLSFNGESVELHADRYFRKLNDKFHFVDPEFFKEKNEMYAEQREDELSKKISQTSLSYDDYQKKRNVQLLNRTKSLVRDL